MRVFALSDIHVDYPENMAWIKALSNSDYLKDALLLAGDVTHDPDRLETALRLLRAKFAHLFFVPGNHELWVMKNDSGTSLDKFQWVLDLCNSLGVHTEPLRLNDGDQPFWIVPLYSWYVIPEEGVDSLYLPKANDPGLQVWSDQYFVKWPTFPQNQTPATYFLRLNRVRVNAEYDAPVLSFSHFLSRQDLMFRVDMDMEQVFERVRQAATQPPSGTPSPRDFNFSRVAGSKSLDAQIRELGSQVHVHGHQHRNRFRTVDGILYVSHCLGYKHERLKGVVRVDGGPLKIWDTQQPVAVATPY